MSDSLVYVYVYGAKSRVHVAFLHDGNVLTNERCNLDDLAADEREIVDSLDVIDGRERLAAPAGTSRGAAARPVRQQRHGSRARPEQQPDVRRLRAFRPEVMA